MNIPFRTLKSYHIPEFKEINFPPQPEEINLIFCLPEEELTDKHKNMIIKMANDIQLYIDTHSLIITVPKNTEFNWQQILKSPFPLKIVFFGPELHSLSGSMLQEWHHLQQHMFLNTYTLTELASDKSKALAYWKIFKPVFNQPKEDE